MRPSRFPSAAQQRSRPREPSTAAAGETIENTARVVPAAGTSDPTPAIASDIDPVELRADLSVTQTGPATVVAGNHITYTLTVHNAGPSADENVLLEEIVPVELTFVSVTGPCTAFPCSLATLAPGATVSLEVTYAVPEIYLPDTVVSAARVSSSTLDPNESNNTSTTTATVAPGRGRGDPQADLTRHHVASRRGCDLFRDRDQSRSRACHRYRRQGPVAGGPDPGVGPCVSGKLRASDRSVDRRDVGG